MSNELMHFGIKGMKWGVRRYQNDDGTVTALGEKKAQVKSDLKKATRSHNKSDMARLYILSENSKMQRHVSRSRIRRANQSARLLLSKSIRRKASLKTKPRSKPTIEQKPRPCSKLPEE